MDVKLLDDPLGEHFPSAGRSKVGMLIAGTPVSGADVAAGVVLHDIDGKPMAALSLTPPEAVDLAVKLFRVSIRLQDCVQREKAKNLVTHVLGAILTQIVENATRCANPPAQSESLLPGSSIIVE